MSTSMQELIQTESCRYGKMSFFKNDTTISRSLAEYGEWAQAEIEFLEALISPTDTVLDIGAFIGTHTLALARKVVKGKVHAFEPQPIFFELLSKNIRQNGLMNVVTHNLAVSEVAGTFEVGDIKMEDSGNFGGTSVLERWSNLGAQGSRTSIGITTIDQLGINECSLVKIDVENMEINVLKGARETIRAARPIIFAECHSLQYGWPVVEFALAENYQAYLFNVRAYNADNFRHNRHNFFGDSYEASLVLFPVEKVAAILDHLKQVSLPEALIPISRMDDLALGLLKKSQYKHEVLATTEAATVLGVDFWANETEVGHLRDTIKKHMAEQVALQESREQAVSALAHKRLEQQRIAKELAAIFVALREVSARHESEHEALYTLGHQLAEQQRLAQGLETLRQDHEEEVARLEQKLQGQRQLAKELVALKESGERTVSAFAGELAKLNAEHLRAVQEVQTKSALLVQIYSSHGWRVLSRYYALRKTLLRSLAKLQSMPRTVRENLTLLVARRLVKRSGLFDRQWYLGKNPDVSRAGVDPLRHYLTVGGFEGRDPHPFFDSDWYLRQYPDVASAHVNPLRHYLDRGALEHRNPNPWFDSRSYLQEHPELAKTKVNPLSHYLQHHGYTRPDRPACSVQNRPLLTPRPIAYPTSPSQNRPAAARRLICVTHVLPYPPSAGNEYRIHRLLTWLSKKGFEVFLVVCPLPGEPIPEKRIQDACSVYSNVIVSQRDGTLLHHLATDDARIGELAGTTPRVFSELLNDHQGHPPLEQKLSDILSTFCPDPLAEVLCHLDSVLNPDIVLVDYVFMTRVVPLLRRESLKVVDTIDVFSTKQDKVVQFGISDGLALSEQEEASLLSAVDLIIAIQPNEAEKLQRLAPNKRVITVGIDFDLVDALPCASGDPVVLMAASDNPMNVKGLADFLRFAWPLVRREIPGVELRVVGAVGNKVQIDDPRVKLMGWVEDVSAAYLSARVVINPAIAGTGLKVKTVEALCHLRPIVVWPAGVDGIGPEISALCRVATDWYNFARHVIDLCTVEDGGQAMISKRDKIGEEFSAENIYRELGLVVDALPHSSRS